MCCIRIPVAAVVIATALLQNPTQAQEPSMAWHEAYDGGAGQQDEGMIVLFAADGHPIVGGMRTPAGGRSEIFMRKLDRTDGSALWTHIASDPLGNDLLLSDMLLDHRGDLMVAGYLSDCSG
jgi:hypothetical protein